MYEVDLEHVDYGFNVSSNASLETNHTIYDVIEEYQFTQLLYVTLPICIGVLIIFVSLYCLLNVIDYWKICTTEYEE
ncbi:unnamed protein product [Nezara viridula]|uniref:Uncharacterized protein n=1 Tax=Nezara viridula TaxID=85310 RepID=A0A9P0MZC7_NEZVI|nr:unnamed protein product [Nezara viridula]